MMIKVFNLSINGHNNYCIDVDYGTAITVGSICERLERYASLLS